MKALRHVNTENIIALDIETVRISPDFKTLNNLYQQAWEYKNKNDGEIPSKEKSEDLWQKQAALYPEFSKICAVSVAYNYKGELHCRNFASYSEVALLRDLAAFLNKVNEKGNYTLCGHAMLYFDIPFLCKRFLINSLEIPGILDESDSKPWEKKILDTNVLWKSFGTGSGSSLFALCVALDVEISKVDLVGDEVGKAYYEGKLEKIASYCGLDAIATYNVLRRLKLETVFAQADVIYDTKGELIEPVPLIEAIKNTGNITKGQEDELQAYIDKLGEGDKEIIRLILRAAVVDDNGKIKPALEKKIREL